MTRFWNNTKTAMLLGGLMGLFLLVGSFYGQQGLIIALVFGLVMNFGAFFFSDKIAIKAMRGREEVGNRATRSTHGRRAAPDGPTCPCPGSTSARSRRRMRSRPGAARRRRRSRRPWARCSCSDEDEMRGVMAHELAHIKNRDTLTSTIAATVAGVLAFIAQWGFLFMGGRNENSNPLVMIAS
jgi:heat shock protein HtpX